ncbi:MAG: hypothetical protein JNM72_00440 [Deltaproteobacteria bacterium]|nr:hypothetical protein [Deltaproteobacteria bacterium]
METVQPVSTVTSASPESQAQTQAGPAPSTAASPQGMGSLIPPTPPSGGDAGPSAPALPATFNSYDPVSKQWLSAGGARGSARWDSKAKAFLGTDQASTADTKVDERGFAGLAFTADEKAAADVTLNGGNLKATDLHHLDMKTVQAIDPQSAVPAKILQSALDESWHEAKAELTTGDGNLEVRKTLMKKLWEFRQWDHDQVLRVVKGKLPKSGEDPFTLASPYPQVRYKGYFPTAGTRLPDDALKEWAAAGSTTLTSDIDVNLKGAATELAVPAFNAEFKAPRSGFKFNREPGVTYDVNVYAMDFMHGAGVSVEGPDGKPSVATSQEFGEAVMGAKSATDPTQVEKGRKGLSGAAARKGDADSQEIWAHVKVRRYMTAAEWQEYKNDIVAAGHSRDDEAGAEAAQMMVQAEARYETWRQTMLLEMMRSFAPMESQADEVQQLADAAPGTGVQQLDAAAHYDNGLSGDPSHGQVEDRQMAASNRVYEQKLQAIAQRRRACRALQTELSAGTRKADDVKAELDAEYAELRNLLAEASLYANEAYVTDGAVNHTVVALQIGRPLQQDKRAMLNAVIENHADVRKEVGRHDSWLGEAAYKAGKYMWRLGDAAKNLGVDHPSVEAVYGAGYDIANKVKGGAGDPEELSAAEIEANMGVTGRKGSKDGISAMIGQVDVLSKQSQVRVKELRSERQLAPAKAAVAPVGGKAVDRREPKSEGSETT